VTGLPNYSGEWTPELIEAGFKVLREPFPPEHVGKLPRNESKTGTASTCEVCGGWHKPTRLHLDFVGHAYVCDRLDAVDPFWVLRPMLDVSGAPLVVEHEIPRGRGDDAYVARVASLQVTLTVMGITRHEVGQASMGADEWMKNLYSDCYARAAMRFGVARYLWQKETPVTAENFASSGGGPSDEEIRAWIGEAKALAGALEPDGRAKWEAWKAERSLSSFPAGATPLQVEGAVALLRNLAEADF